MSAHEVEEVVVDDPDFDVVEPWGVSLDEVGATNADRAFYWEFQAEEDARRLREDRVLRERLLRRLGYSRRGRRELREHLDEVLAGVRRTESQLAVDPDLGVSPEEFVREQYALLLSYRATLAELEELCGLGDAVALFLICAMTDPAVMDVALFDALLRLLDEVVEDEVAARCEHPLDDLPRPLLIRPTLCPNGPNAPAPLDVTHSEVASSWALAA